MVSTPVRQNLVYANGRIHAADAAWQHKIRYEDLKSGGLSPSDGSAADEKETLRERKETTVID